MDVKFKGDARPESPVVARIRKLLALAKDKSAAPGEVSNAAAMAARIMAEHGIEEGDIAAIEEVDEGYATLKFENPHHIQWHMVALSSAAQASDCSALFQSGGRAIILGFRHDVEVAWHLYDYIQFEVRRLARQYVARTGAPPEREHEVMATYALASVQSIHDRLMIERDRALRGRGAMVHVKSAKVEKEVNERYDVVERQVEQKVVDPFAVLMGILESAQVKPHRGIGAAPGTVRKGEVE